MDASKQTKPKPLPHVLTVDEVAEVLRIGRAAAYELVRSGSLASLRFGRTIRVPRTAVLAMLGEQDDE